MKKFSISDLARYSGIKAHTIRVWEQRYQALSPYRSEGNTRYYADDQLRRLLNIAGLIKLGYKISELGGLSDDELFNYSEKFLTEQSTSGEPEEYFIHQMLSAAIALDEAHFEKFFAHCLIRYGMVASYTKIIYPLLKRIGLMWSADTIAPANEHFISNLLKQKLFAAIDALPPPKKTGEPWLLFLKEDEFHELGLLIANFAIRKSLRPVIYLGANLPFWALSEAIEKTQPKYLLFFVVRKEDPGELQSYLDAIAANFAGEKIYIATSNPYQTDGNFSSKVQWLSSLEELMALLSVPHGKYSF